MSFCLESSSRKTLLHGEAIAVGMILATHLSYQLIDFPTISFPNNTGPSNIVQDSNGLVYFTIIDMEQYGIYSTKIFRINPDSGELTSRSNQQESQNISHADLTFYPNPFNNILTIKNSENNPIQSISILNKLGTPVLIRRVESMTEKIQLNTTKLGKGVYFIKVLLNNGDTEIKQLVKN